jgi:hypothetical protein
MRTSTTHVLEAAERIGQPLADVMGDAASGHGDKSEYQPNYNNAEAII